MTEKEIYNLETEFLSKYKTRPLRYDKNWYNKIIDVPEQPLLSFLTKLHGSLNKDQLLVVDYMKNKTTGKHDVKIRLIDSSFENDEKHTFMDRKKFYLTTEGYATEIIWRRAFDRDGAVSIGVVKSFISSILAKKGNGIKIKLLKEIWGVKKISYIHNLEVYENEIKVLSSPHQTQFFKLMNEMGDNVKVKTLYHGTQPYNLPKILNNGFKLGSSVCAFGRGIYLGATDKAKYFTNHEKLLIECEVIYTNVFQPKELLYTKAKDEMIKNNGDILYYTGFNKPEYVIYNAHQVHINRIIKV